MTASEPLSLEEEYAMQMSWKEDPNKCTFIVLALEDEAGGIQGGEGEGSAAQATAAAAAAVTAAAAVAAAATTAAPVMAGDVNLFFNDYDDPGMCEVRCVILPRPFRNNSVITM